jgi:dTDP-4-dehydrorhamnose reductase
MIFLLGATGYIGAAFASELRRRDIPFRALSRKEFDYTRFHLLVEILQTCRPELVINAAGYTGKPNVDSCEIARAETLLGNVLLPHTIVHACAMAGVPWGHVSSGCVYSGAKVSSGGMQRIEKDLTQPELQQLLRRSPERFTGFTEDDEPNFSFRQPPCSFYSGTKALGEETIADVGNGFIWRLRIPFDEQDHARNYLSKLQRYEKVYDNVNSISHRTDFVRACLDLWAMRAPFGTYNVTNPGFVTARQVIGMIERILQPPRRFEFWRGDAEFYMVAAKTPRSNCILDVTKLLGTGVAMRTAEEAVEDALFHWQAHASGAEC